MLKLALLAAPVDQPKLAQDPGDQICTTNLILSRTRPAHNQPGSLLRQRQLSSRQMAWPTDWLGPFGDQRVTARLLGSP